MDPIQTNFIFPPIPMREFDWCAYRDPERLPYGWGRTEAEAIADLLQLEEDEEPCPYCREGRSHTSALCRRSGGQG